MSLCGSALLCSLSRLWQGRLAEHTSSSGQGCALEAWASWCSHNFFVRCCLVCAGPRMHGVLLGGVWRVCSLPLRAVHALQLLYMVAS